MHATRALSPDAFPARLCALRDPPPTLYVRGSVPEGPTVAIVGTRRADLAACDFAAKLARELARAGVGVVSGGAEGIDAAAHEGALAGGARTWVVLPTSIERPYPAPHRALFERVLEGGGGWLSERAPEEASARWHFLARNRLIAALSDATVIVQAPAKSGALSTARAAKKLGRPLFAVAASPWDQRAAGNRALLQRGARACEGAADVLAGLGRSEVSLAPLTLPLPPPLDPCERKVFEALDGHPAPVHEIVRRTGLGVIRVRVALVRLAAKDLADQRPGGWRAVA